MFPPKIRVVMLDDHKTGNGTMKLYLETFPDLEVVGMASSGQELLDKINEWQPQVLLLDLKLDNPMNGVEVIRALVNLESCPKIVILSACKDEDPLVVQALQAGAMSYVPKAAEPEEVVAAIQAAAQDRPTLTPYLNRLLLTTFRQLSNEAGGLSPKERQILTRLVQGESNQEIGKHLALAEDTVKKYITSISSKLGVSGRPQLTIQAIKQGLVDPEQL